MPGGELSIAARRRALPPAAAVMLAIALGLPAPWWCAAAAGPMLALAIGLATSPPALRRVGWTLVRAGVAAAAILIAGARLAG